MSKVNVNAPIVMDSIVTYILVSIQTFRMIFTRGIEIMCRNCKTKYIFDSVNEIKFNDKILVLTQIP